MTTDQARGPSRRDLLLGAATAGAGLAAAATQVAQAAPLTIGLPLAPARLALQTVPVTARTLRSIGAATERDLGLVVRVRTTG